ncbi:MAG: hypothetical protein PVG39_29955 [Desulfobacteraceae bacterium]|jgi:hypothetical protein
MKILTATVLFLIIACSGCGGPSRYWYNENNTIRQADKDCRDCYHLAQIEAMETSKQMSRDYGTPFSVGKNYIDTQIKKCMKDKGYVEIWDDNLDPTVKKRTVEYGANHSDPMDLGFMYNIAGN